MVNCKAVFPKDCASSLNCTPEITRGKKKNVNGLGLKFRKLIKTGLKG